MSIHDRCWQCRYARRIKATAEYAECNDILVCAQRPPDKYYHVGNSCDDQRQSGSKKDCGPDARFFVHRDLQILTHSERARHGKGGCPQEYDEWSRHCVTADIFAKELSLNEGRDIPYDRIEEICKFANNLRLQLFFEEAA